MSGSQMDLATMRASALSAAKKATLWVYRNNYTSGAQTISRHEPDDHTRHLTGVRSWDYAAEAGCSFRTALVHLRKLVAAGKLVEVKRYSSACDFKLLHEDADAIGRELIAELRAQGLPFDDDWRAARAANNHAGATA